MPLQVQLLPTSAADGSQMQPLTTFLINQTLALDAGSLGYALDAQALARVGHVVLTHAHLDHTGSLPIAIAEVYPLLKAPLKVYGTAHTLRTVRTHLFNNDVWLDFSKLPLPGSTESCVQFIEIEPRQSFELDGVRFTPIPVNHSAPTVGFVVQSAGTSVVFTSDTHHTDEIWAEANKLTDLKAVFIECSFPDEFAKLAEDSGHLTPRMVAQEIAKITTSRPPVYCVHLKPGSRDKLLEQLRPMASRGVGPAEISKVYQW